MEYRFKRLYQKINNCKRKRRIRRMRFLDQCFLLIEENLINKIANTGYNKCHQSGYSNQEKFKKLFKESIK